MKMVAKLLIKCDGKYLMMRRSGHPTYGSDPDLPGGTVEEGESALAAMLREVQEEIGIEVARGIAKELFSGNRYSSHGTHYSLFAAEMTEVPTLEISWEHSGYEWVDKDVFISMAARAKDSYMHMVADTLKSVDF